jgi:hypothetical protein
VLEAHAQRERASYITIFGERHINFVLGLAGYCGGGGGAGWCLGCFLARYSARYTYITHI